MSSARNRKGWSAKDLASRSQNTANYVYSIERGRSIPTMTGLSASPTLELEPSYLLALSNRGRSVKAANTQRRLDLRRGLSVQEGGDAR